ncbi:MAG: Ppx/GppA phosphatase [Deferribacteraceae bacterium]|jgi:exopolyphosphatase/guanosine-5'-triphosphate,3'-diphosphate pyrophosphatase|nr:Ppx/GppA phosphatase [Deferribacteraceae bacterium]
MQTESKIAIIDLGTNSLRLQIFKIIDNQFELIDDFKEIIRLGDDIYNYGYILEKSIEKLLEHLIQIKIICESRQVNSIRFIATASLRETQNSNEVKNKIINAIGIEPEIISGEKEAYFAYLAAKSNFEINDSKVLITDIGGGSAEFVLVENDNIIFSESTPLGCNKLLHKYFKNDPPQKVDIVNFKNDLKEFFQQKPFDRSIEHIICLGGTLNNIANIQHSTISGQRRRVKYVDRKFLKRFTRIIANNSIENRKKIKGLEPKRADIVLPAALLIDNLLDSCGKSGFYALSGGLRLGILIDTANNMGLSLSFQNNQNNLKFTRVYDICKKYKGEIAHAENVKKIAKKLFFSFKELLELTDEDLELLEAAAILHDIGNHISYSQHHKHSYYLIVNSDFIGFSNLEIQMIANIARYHRKSFPKQSHENFIKLSELSQEKVNKLSAILRIADSLDRSHEQKVKDIKVDITPSKIILKLIGKGDLILEKAGVNKKKDFLEKMINKKLEVL